jgi:hypothetical protein
MSKDAMRGKSEDGITPNSEGLKRRDVLLSGTSLVAASALLGEVTTRSKNLRIRDRGGDGGGPDSRVQPARRRRQRSHACAAAGALAVIHVYQRNPSGRHPLLGEVCAA